MFAFHALIANFACFFNFIFRLQWSALTFPLPSALGSCNWDGDECREVQNWCCTREAPVSASGLCPGHGQPPKHPVPTSQRETGDSAPTPGMETGCVRDMPRNSQLCPSGGTAPPCWCGLPVKVKLSPCFFPSLH